MKRLVAIVSCGLFWTIFVPVCFLIIVALLAFDKLDRRAPGSA